MLLDVKMISSRILIIALRRCYDFDCDTHHDWYFYECSVCLTALSFLNYIIFAFFFLKMMDIITMMTIMTKLSVKIIIMIELKASWQQLRL